MALLLIKNVFETPAAQQHLTRLYQQTQSECMRHEKLGMEVGSAR